MINGSKVKIKTNCIINYENSYFTATAIHTNSGEWLFATDDCKENKHVFTATAREIIQMIEI